MSGSEKNTKVRIEPDVKFGEFANAFRVVEEVGGDCFLDFMVYSAQAEEAVVVSRVRVRREFLTAIQDRLKEALHKFDGSEAVDAVDAVDNSVFRKLGEPIH